MYAIAFDFSFIPLTHVNISINRFPHSSPMLFILMPFSRVVLSIIPIKLTYLSSLAMYKFAFINPLLSYLHTLVFFRFAPFPFKNPIFGYHYPLSIHIPLLNITKIQRNFVVKLYTKIATSHQIINIYMLIFAFV